MKTGWLEITGGRGAGSRLASRSSRRRKMTRVVGAAVLALAGLGAVAAFPSATFADGVCGGGAFSSSSGTASCTYSPGSYNFTVPGGVTQERVQVAGGQGGQAGPAQPGGLGGYASAITSVTPGYALVISVGCRGGDGDGSVQGGGGAGAGGCGGGGNGGNGGGQQRPIRLRRRWRRWPLRRRLLCGRRGPPLRGWGRWRRRQRRRQLLLRVLWYYLQVISGWAWRLRWRRRWRIKRG